MVCCCSMGGDLEIVGFFRSPVIPITQFHLLIQMQNIRIRVCVYLLMYSCVHAEATWRTENIRITVHICTDGIDEESAELHLFERWGDVCVCLCLLTF